MISRMSVPRHSAASHTSSSFWDEFLVVMSILLPVSCLQELLLRPEHRLTEGEILQLCNLRPTQDVVIHCIVEDYEERFGSGNPDILESPFAEKAKASVTGQEEKGREEDEDEGPDFDELTVSRLLEIVTSHLPPHKVS